jgi:hypothetical protein
MRRRTIRGAAVSDAPQDGIPFACRVRLRRDLAGNPVEGFSVAGDDAHAYGMPIRFRFVLAVGSLAPREVDKRALTFAFFRSNFD